MSDFLRFEIMITPVLIQIFFWIALVVVVILGIVQMASGGYSVVTGLLTIILGPIGVRVYAEILMVFFRINDHLRQIEHNTRHG